MGLRLKFLFDNLLSSRYKEDIRGNKAGLG